MAEKDYDRIVKRAAWGLGPDWTIGEVRVSEPLPFLAPTYVHDVEGRDFITLSWLVEEDYEVSEGRGSVLTVGRYPGQSVFEEKPLDEITAFLREKVPGYFAPKKKLFGRG